MTNPSQLTLLVLQLAFLALLWIFIFLIVSAIRSDLFGQRVRSIRPTSADDQNNEPDPDNLDPFGAVKTSFSGSASSIGTPTNTNNSPKPPLHTNSQDSATDTGLCNTTNVNHLVITSGSRAGLEFPLGEDEITIGRSSDSAVIIRDDFTSTHHARLVLSHGIWMIQDLKSTNGTLLNGVRLTERTAIPLGANIKVGSTTFELQG